MKALTKLKALGADVILVNPQYAPRVLAKAEADHMLKIISTAAHQANVNLFDRFAVMRHWRDGREHCRSTRFSRPTSST